MPPSYFDTSLGTTQNVPEEARNTKAQRTLVPLAHLLVAQEFEFQKGDFDIIRLRDWDAERGISMGRIVTKELAELDPPAAFTQKTISRLHILGLFPDFNYIRLHFKTLHNFVEIIDGQSSIEHNSNKRFDDMAHDELIVKLTTTYREFLDERDARNFDRPLTKDILELMYQLDEGPSMPYLQRRFGGIRKINEYLGFPDIRSWSLMQYIQYGADIIRLNGVDSLTRDNIQLLARNNCGPYAASIRLKCGNWTEFKRQAHIHYQEELSEVAEIAHMAGKDTNENAHPAHKLAEVPQYRAIVTLLKAFLPYEHVRLPQRLDSGSVNAAISTILEHRPSLTIADIEIGALTLNLNDDLWPTPVKFKRLPIISHYAA